MGTFTGKIGIKSPGLMVPGRIYVAPATPEISYGSIKFRSFKLENKINFKFDIKKTAE